MLRSHISEVVDFVRGSGEVFLSEESFRDSLVRSRESFG